MAGPQVPGRHQGGRMKRKEQGQEVPSWLCWAAPAAHGWDSVLASLQEQAGGLVTHQEPLGR